MDAASKIHNLTAIFSISSSFCSELHRNREFYRTHDVRPPFTYVDMIRQVGRMQEKLRPTYCVVLLSKWHI